MEKNNQIMDENAVRRALARITYEILERNQGADSICLVGILSRGKFIAQRIAAKIQELEHISVPCGVLDITPYRDDVPHGAEKTEKAFLSFPVENQNVIICDDVIYTGRSSRAAIEAVMQQGRPRSVQLAVLVDRGHREVPIRPDYVGKNLPTSRAETVQVSLTEQDGVDQVRICQPEYSGRKESMHETAD